MIGRRLASPAIIRDMPYQQYSNHRGPKPGSRKRSIIRNILIALFIIGLAAGAAYWYTHRPDQNPANQAVTRASETASSSPKSNRIRLIAAGDFNYNDTVNLSARNSDGSYDYLKLQPQFPGIFKAANIRFCNQITLIAGDKFGIRGYPKFNAPLEAAGDMQKLGCNLINMASNHSFDVNQDAINANVEEWTKQPGVLAAAGQNRSAQELEKVHFFSVQGVKFAFLAYTTYINRDAPAQNDYGVTQFSRALAQRQIAEARSGGAQFIIASMRWGTEYSSEISAGQQSDARFLADEGVSLVLGHGTHVVQPVVELTGAGGNNTVVWYGLGNYINSQIPAETLFGGLAVIDIDPAEVKVASNRFLPLYVHYEWTAQQAAAEDLLKRKNFKMYLLEDATQSMLDSQQLKTTAAEQKQRMQTVLSSQGGDVRLITAQEYLDR